ncbi:MAG: Fic family protein [Vicinamibacterales bacterium]
MAYIWQSIADLSSAASTPADQQTASVIELWRSKADALRQTTAYRDFLIKLRREWAIETGVLERLYSLTEGATKTLIEQGLDAALLSHGDTDRSPADVMALIRDQHAVVEGLYQFIGGERSLSVSYVNELHQALTAHQAAYDAKDTLGQYVLRPMQRGVFKKLKNNVELEDGSSFEFCPPEHVAAEMDALIRLHDEHVVNGVPPDVQAAWLHHRFTLIHPYVDGNGRVARALATLVYLKAEWFPLVVKRDDKVSYLRALRTADAGDLNPLVVFFGELQRRAVRQALSLVDEVEQEAQALGAILGAVGARLARRRQAREQELQKAVTTADVLRVLTEERTREVAVQLNPLIKQDRATFEARSAKADRDDPRAKYNRWQIVQAARAAGYFANLELFPSWVELQIDASMSVRILIAFHGIGHEWLGLLGAVSVAYRKEPSSEDGHVEVVDLEPLCTEPFEITYTDDPIEVKQRYRKWLEASLLKGLDYWQKFV